MNLHSLGMSLVVAACPVILGATGTEDPAVRCLTEDIGSDRVVSPVCRLDADESVRIIDGMFSRGKSFADESVRGKLKHLVRNGFAEMYTWEERVCYRSENYTNRVYNLVHLMPEIENTVWWGGDNRRGSMEPEVLIDYCGYRTDKPERLECFECGRLERKWFDVIGRACPVEIAAERSGSCETEVVADVENVRLMSLTAICTGEIQDPVETQGKDNDEEEEIRGTFPRVEYLVSMRVRTVLKGSVGFKRFSFRVALDEQKLTPEGQWMFYRGITLAVGFSGSDDARRIVRVDPVLPYAPYSKENIRLYWKCDELNECEFGDVDPFGRIGALGNIEPLGLVMNYGDHTVVKFGVTTNVVTGMNCACPDFSLFSTVEVWTDGPGSDPEYWRNAWFGYSQQAKHEDRGTGWSDSRVKLRRVHDLKLNEEIWPVAIFEFSMRGLRGRIGPFDPPSTMADVVEWFNREMAVRCAGRRCVTLAVDPSVSNRVVRPLPARDADLLETFKLVCVRNGCDYAAEDGNDAVIVIKPVLTEAQCTVPDAVELWNELSAAGFASVKDADYMTLRPRDYWKWYDILGYPVSYDSCVDGGFWVKPVPGNTNSISLVAFDFVWWTVAKEAFGNSLKSARLRRDVGRVIFTLEDMPEVDPDYRAFSPWSERIDVDSYFALTFAMHIYELGYVKESRRILELLWHNPVEAVEALGKLRKRLKKLNTKYASAESWFAKDVKKERAKGEKNPAADDDEEDDDDED